MQVCSSQQKEWNKFEVMKDVYGTRIGEVYEYGLAEATNEDELNSKLATLKNKWDKAVPGFYNWFVTHRKKDFAESVIKSAREGTQLDGLYYQNDVESLHAIEKRIQGFKKQDVLGAVRTGEELIRQEENDEVLALYGNSNCVLAPMYKSWKAPVWHSWTPARRQEHLKKFRSFVPSIEATFRKPRKPGLYPRSRSQVKPTFVFDRHASTSLPTQSVAPVSATTSSSNTSDAAFTSSVSTTDSSLSSFNIGDAISFPDPRIGKEKPFKLHLKRLASKMSSKITTCRGNCGEKIDAGTVLLVKPFGESTYYDKKTGSQKTRHVLYVHFQEKCLKRFDSDNYYSPLDSFPYEKITLDPESKLEMPDHKVQWLSNTGIQI